MDECGKDPEQTVRTLISKFVLRMGSFLLPRWDENKGAIRALGGEAARAEAGRTERSVIRELVVELEAFLERSFRDVAEVR